MSTAWESPIIRISSGLLNTVNDAAIANQVGIGSLSKFAGQLGKHVWFGPENIGQLFSATVGTLYAGRFRYVRLRSTDDASPALGVGKIIFWDRGKLL